MEEGGEDRDKEAGEVKGLGVEQEGAKMGRMMQPKKGKGLEKQDIGRRETEPEAKPEGQPDTGEGGGAAPSLTSSPRQMCSFLGRSGFKTVNRAGRARVAVTCCLAVPCIK